ncbi:hypothetical protein NM208_g3472 [Fusarium decemcellulare]|uniref:Uncharacterized protein n=1 Tax=Fusarium decemcellulare TaxID=57161 RepID=A0ACC1SP31_9HYPO|nr:hypothetical protein NM208_g3472 [Fusarium decemcellulare]
MGLVVDHAKHNGSSSVYNKVGLAENDAMKANTEHTGGARRVFTPNETKRLIRKIDWTLLPLLSLLYLLSFLDRANIGNARLAGLEEDLNMTDRWDYSTAVSVFFPFYVASEIPSNLAMKRFRPSIWIPSIMLAWGIVMTLMGIVNSYAGLLAARMALGLAEGGLFPGVTYYITLWYKRHECGFRIAIFFSAATAAGAFGGLLARGIVEMAGIAGLNGWAWIFILEGLLTVVIALYAYYGLHDYPETASFLSPDEREEVVRRLQDDSSVLSNELRAKFVKDALGDWKIWIHMFITIGIFLPVYSVSIFLPTIIRSMGHNAELAQLMSVPPYVTACLVTVAGGFAADRQRQRGVYMICFCIIGIVGLIILINVENNGVKYFACFLVLLGIFPSVPQGASWNGNNIGGSTKRGVGLAMHIGFGNLGGAIAGFIYRQEDAPHYRTGHGTLIATLGMSCALATFMTWYLRRENARRDRVYKAPSEYTRAEMELEAYPPFSISIAEFMRNDEYGRYPLSKSRPPFVCGLTGKSYSAVEVVQRENYLARAIEKRLGLCHKESEWDRVVSLFSLNTIDYVPLTHAIHSLSGIVSPANPASSALELEEQLRSSGAIAMFTCLPLLQVALKAAKAVEIPSDRIFILPMHSDSPEIPFTTIDDLVKEGSDLPEINPIKWSTGQGARQTAYLCYSSGTSGLPKAVMVSHYNLIANVMQLTAYESFYRKQSGFDSQILLGLLPFSHSYGLVIMGHVAPYRGDQVIVLPKFELDSFLLAIQQFRIQQLNIAPPILVQMITSLKRCAEFDLGSVRYVYAGGAPLGTETIESLCKLYPHWHIGQVYGMTETAVVITSTSESDILYGSSGSLLPSMKAKLIDPEGREITAHHVPGELVVQGPSLTLGYLNNEKATAETFFWDEDGRWIKTGDEAIVCTSPQGYEHFVIVDRIKELIKVKGMQVSPAELEAHLLSHPFVADCAVIQTYHERSGEVPKAFVVRSKEAASTSEAIVSESICEHVKKHKARYKWLAGGG